MKFETYSKHKLKSIRCPRFLLRVILVTSLLMLLPLSLYLKFIKIIQSLELHFSFFLR